jgi:hypothetical protein
MLVSLATLDAILSPEWEFRYYSFDKDWDPERGHRMGSMRNGMGDEFHALFTAAGVALRGFDHEAPMARFGEPPAGVFDGFPEEIVGFLDEPAFTLEDTSFCLWHPTGGPWTMGTVSFCDGQDPDGSERLLELFTARPEDYQGYARDYFERELPLDPIARIYHHEPLTDELIQTLNPETSLVDLSRDLEEIGYPIAVTIQ